MVRLIQIIIIYQILKPFRIRAKWPKADLGLDPVSGELISLSVCTRILSSCHLPKKHGHPFAGCASLKPWNPKRRWWSLSESSFDPSTVPSGVQSQNATSRYEPSALAPRHPPFLPRIAWTTTPSFETWRNADELVSHSTLTLTIIHTARVVCMIVYVITSQALHTLLWS